MRSDQHQWRTRGDRDDGYNQTIYLNIPDHDTADTGTSRFGIILYYFLLLLIAAALVGYGQQIARPDTHHEGPGIPHSKRTPMSFQQPNPNWIAREGDA